MPPRQIPTVRLRRLAAELRTLRAEAGLSQDQVAEQTMIAPATLWRIEAGKGRPQRRTIVTLLDLYGVGKDEPRRAELLELAKQSAQLGWLQAVGTDLDDEYRTYISFEDEARLVRNYESLYIPGLLQTEAYARAAISAGAPMADRDFIEGRVSARIKRQEVLTRKNSLTLWAILDEAALHRWVGGAEVMREQINHLVDFADRPNVVVQILHYELGAHGSMEGSFSILDFPDPEDPPIVYVDSPAGDLFIERSTDLDRFRATFEHLQAAALNPADSIRRMRSVAATLATKEASRE